MDGTTYKLRVRIGVSEFEAEGDEATVKEQYRMFLDAIAEAPGAPPVPRAAASRSDERPLPFDGGPAPAAAPDNGTGIPSALMDRVFSNIRGVISLRSLPQSETRDADALLLLLYGFLKLKDEFNVYGTQLMKAARQSGLNIDRVDRVISDHRGLYLRGGARRGATYSLNNQGEIKAEGIMQSMFQ